MRGLCKGIHIVCGPVECSVIDVERGSRCGLQFSIHSNIPTKHFNIEMQESKNNNENTIEIKHITMNGSMFKLNFRLKAHNHFV